MASSAVTTSLHDLWSDWGAQFGEQDGQTLPLRFGEVGPEYAACRESCALADGGDRGLLLLRGKDLRTFLQRILSSDVFNLPADGGQWSALLDGKGHLITDLLVFAFDGGVLLDAPASRLASLDQKLDMYQFGEELTWEAPELARLLILGPDAEHRVRDLGLEIPTARAAAPAQDGFGLARSGDEWVLRRPDRGIDCLELLAEPAAVRGHAEELRAMDARPAGLVALDILRVEAGLPRWGADFDTESILPEISQWQRASVTKGCYAGQEVVARVHTYGEAPRQICRLRFAEGTTPLHGAELRDEEDKRVGRVSSWVYSPVEDAPIGLGLLRRRAARTGARITAVDPGGERVEATVSVPDKVLG